MSNNRLEKLRTLLKENDLDGAIISGRPNTIYFAGFTGTTSSLLVGSDNAWLIVDFRYTIQAKKQAFEGIEAIQYEDTLHGTLNELIKDNRLEKLGFEGLLPFSEYEAFRDKLPNAKSRQ
jgi:Xaa-Pro aminopeptidase